MSVNVQAGLHPYLAGFVRALEGVEITSGQGGALTIDEGIDAVVERIVSVKRSGAKALLIGNGGSAAIVSHVHNDLCKSVGVRAIVFNETPLLTAVANDHGYHEVFRRPLELWADRHDLLIAVSSSGESANIVNAATLAKQMGCRIVTFSGFEAENRLRRIGDVNIYVPASSYGHVEMVHAVIAHCVSDLASIRAAGTA